MRLITPITKKTELYSDFTKDLFLNPVTLDIVRKTNEEAVKEAIKNLILTDKGERLMQPEVGSDIRKMLFENYTIGTATIIEELVRSTIESYEPRAELLSFSIVGSPDQHSVSLNIVFAVSMIEDPISFNVIVQRLR